MGKESQSFVYSKDLPCRYCKKAKKYKLQACKECYYKFLAPEKERVKYQKKQAAKEEKILEIKKKIKLFVKNIEKKKCSVCKTKDYERKLYKGKAVCVQCIDSILKASQKAKELRAELKKIKKEVRKRFTKEERSILSKIYSWEKKGVSNLPTLEYIVKIRKELNGVCPACHRPVGKKGWCWHHNHQTNSWIGEICSKCNTAFGMFADDIAKITLAFQWFKQNHSNI